MACAALHARHSDDKQNEVSIEDQFRLCRENAAWERRRSSVPTRTRPYPVPARSCNRASSG